MKKSIILILAISFLLLGCKNDYSGSDSMNYALEESVMDIAPAPMAIGGDMRKAQQENVMGEMLIKTVYLSLNVDDYSQAREKIDSILKLSNAWISNENFMNLEYQISNDMAIRVPKANLDTLLVQLIGLAKKVTHQRIESADVTEEYIDVESRIKNLRSVESTFVKLLRKTDSIEDILKIESKLAEVRGNIESMEGRIKYLKNRVEYCTVNLTVIQPIEYRYVPQAADRFTERLKKALHGGWKGFVGFVLFLISLWPLWILGLVTWYIVVRYRKFRRLKNQKPKKKEKEKEKEKDRDKKKQKKQQQNDSSDEERDMMV
jgi:hypothetical protein